MTTARAIKGKVAKIMNERELALNRGADAGVQEGMRFQVLQPEVVIEDPDTKEQLGILQREKIKVKVVEVHPKYSIAQTYETYQATFPFSAAESLGPFSAAVARTRVRTLYGEQPAAQQRIDAQGATVSVGDPVAQLPEEESLPRSNVFSPKSNPFSARSPFS